jgi:hypothetical protein
MRLPDETLLLGATGSEHILRSHLTPRSPRTRCLRPTTLRTPKQYRRPSSPRPVKSPMRTLEKFDRLVEQDHRMATMQIDPDAPSIH